MTFSRKLLLFNRINRDLYMHSQVNKSSQNDWKTRKDWPQQNSRDNSHDVPELVFFVNFQQFEKIFPSELSTLLIFAALVVLRVLGVLLGEPISHLSIHLLHALWDFALSYLNVINHRWNVRLLYQLSLPFENLVNLVSIHQSFNPMSYHNHKRNPRF